MVFEFSWCQLELKGPNYFWYDRQEWTPEDLKRELFSSHEMAGDRGWFGVCTENHDQPRSIDHYLPREGRNYYGATMLASMYLLLRGTPYVYQGQEIGMRNCAYASMDDYNDITAHWQMDFHRRKRCVWFSWKAGTMRGHRFNGMIQKMPDLQQENPG